MPKRTRTSARRVATAAVAFALTAPGMASAATRDCDHPPRDAWQAFAAFGDPADYWLAPGGDFERDSPEWSLSGPSVGPGNETAGVLDGQASLRLGNPAQVGVDVGLGSGLDVDVDVPAGVSTAVSPPFCVTAEHPTFRYLLKANGAVGALSTFVRYRAADGSTQEDEVWSRTETDLLPGQWKPSDLQPLATRLPMESVGGVARVQLVFRSPVGVLAPAYQVDNVLVDPYRTR